MPVLKRRSRTVSFRLSEEEYETMRERCISQGARSISDFARKAACNSNGNFNGNDLRRRVEPDLALNVLKERVDEIDREIHRLAQILAASRR
jgi:hypothetical protein